MRRMSITYLPINKMRVGSMLVENVFEFKREAREEGFNEGIEKGIKKKQNRICKKYTQKRF